MYANDVPIYFNLENFNQENLGNEINEALNFSDVLPKTWKHMKGKSP